MAMGVDPIWFGIFMVIMVESCTVGLTSNQLPNQLGLLKVVPLYNDDIYSFLRIWTDLALYIPLNYK